MDVFWDVLKVIICAIILVGEMNAISAATYVNRREAIKGFLLNLLIAGSAIMILTTIEW